MERMDRGVHPTQQYILDFLAHDFGDYTLSSVLVNHPLAQEFLLDKGTLLARFEKFPGRWIVTQDGGMLLIPESRVAS